jgi:hypothetical protein
MRSHSILVVSILISKINLNITKKRFTFGDFYRLNPIGYGYTSSKKVFMVLAFSLGIDVLSVISTIFYG